MAEFHRRVAWAPAEAKGMVDRSCLHNFASPIMTDADVARAKGMDFAPLRSVAEAHHRRWFAAVHGGDSRSFPALPRTSHTSELCPYL
jgi:hypothetical protein